MTLMRGFADDLPLGVWLRDHIWPTEGQWVSPDFVWDGTSLAIAEMLTSGVTCFNDMYFFPEVAAQAALEMGIPHGCRNDLLRHGEHLRAVNADECIDKGLTMRAELGGRAG